MDTLDGHCTVWEVGNPPGHHMFVVLLSLPRPAFHARHARHACQTRHACHARHGPLSCSQPPDDDLTATRDRLERLLEATPTAAAPPPPTPPPPSAAARGGAFKFPEEAEARLPPPASNGGGLLKGGIFGTQAAPTGGGIFKFPEVEDRTRGGGSGGGGGGGGVPPIDDIALGLGEVQDLAERASGLAFFGLTFWIGIPGMRYIFVSFFAVFAVLCSSGSFGTSTFIAQAPGATEGGYYQSLEPIVTDPDAYVLDVDCPGSVCAGPGSVPDPVN